jgi:hypothetical protein
VPRHAANWCDVNPKWLISCRLRCPRRWHIERHNGNYDFPVRVAWLVEHIPEARLIWFCDGSFVVLVFRCCLFDTFQHTRKIGVSIENNYGSFGIAPTQVREQLVDGFEELLLAFPEFAFGDEDISVSLPN